ncbi:Signal transduction histidine kinase, partial [Globisporangium splendens]
MVHYGLSRRAKSSKESNYSNYSARGTNSSIVSSSSASTASISSMSDLLTDADSALSNDPYFHFSSDQQDALLDESRATATALIVDTLSGFDKWRFLTAANKVQLFELKPDAADRVSSMLTDEPQQQLNPQSYTLLGITRVRAKLDDFMRIVATDKRDKFQNLLTCLHEENLQHADVFTAFGSLTHSNSSNSNANNGENTALSSSFSSNSSLSSSRGHRSPIVDVEQYAIKYYSLKGPKVIAPSSRNAVAKKFGRKGKKSATPAPTDDGGLTFCVGEYATIRRGKIRSGNKTPSGSSSNSSRAFDDQRIGIIACHSVGDPQVTRYCKPIASTTGSGFAVTTRSFAQFSGIVVYPVESNVPGESLLEVVVKLSCFDPQGISSLKRRAMSDFMCSYRHLENSLLVLRLHDSPYLSSANWVKSETRKCCNVCQQSFPSFRRKHHCRLCGEVTCSKCSSMHNIKLAKAGKVAFRICATCLHGASDATQRQHRQGDSGPEEEEEEDVEVLERDTRLHHHLQLEQHERHTQEHHKVQEPQEEQLEPQQQQPVLLHKEQLEEHNSRHNSRREEERAEPVLAKQRAESTGSSGESEFYDSRGFLASNVTATTTASTPPSTLASPFSSSPASPSAVVHSDNFYRSNSSSSKVKQEEPDRLSELRAFHDSEYDLDLGGMHYEGTAKESMAFGIDEENFDEEEEDSDYQEQLYEQQQQQATRLSEAEAGRLSEQPLSEPVPKQQAVQQQQQQPERQSETQPQPQEVVHKEQPQSHDSELYQQQEPPKHQPVYQPESPKVQKQAFEPKHQPVYQPESPKVQKQSVEPKHQPVYQPESPKVQKQAFEPKHQPVYQPESPKVQKQSVEPKHQPVYQPESPKAYQHSPKYQHESPKYQPKYQPESPKIDIQRVESPATASKSSDVYDSSGLLAPHVAAMASPSMHPVSKAPAYSSPRAADLQSPAYYSNNQYDQHDEDEKDDNRFSELSVRDFHDSEFELDLGDLHLDSSGRDSRVYDIDEEDEDEDDSDDEDARNTLKRSFALPSRSNGNNSKFVHYNQKYGNHIDEDDDDDDDNGFEFHDSEIGIEFSYDEIEEIEEFNDSKYEAIEEIGEEIQEISTMSAAMVQRNRLLDELRRTRLMDYDIMDSGREQAFDLIAMQAAQFMGCSLASISFVDDKREYIKAASGVQVLRTNINEISKSNSLAAHIVQRCAADDLSMVVVLDARHDEALSTNLFVFDAPFLRFVVGIPIKTRDGVVIGALVLADDRPRREITLTESTVLKDFGEQVNELMEERWQRRMYQRRADPAPEQIQQTLQSLLSQSYHTGQQLRRQGREVERQNFHRSLPPPRARQQRSHQASHYQTTEPIHGRLTMQGIEL